MQKTNIVPHPHAASSVVVQRRTRGRLPKAVASMACYLANRPAEHPEITKWRDSVHRCEELAEFARQELAMALQRHGAGK